MRTTASASACVQRPAAGACRVVRTGKPGKAGPVSRREKRGRKKDAETCGGRRRRRWAAARLCGVCLRATRNLSFLVKKTRRARAFRAVGPDEATRAICVSFSPHNSVVSSTRFGRSRAQTTREGHAALQNTLHHRFPPGSVSTHSQTTNGRRPEPFELEREERGKGRALSSRAGRAC